MSDPIEEFFARLTAGPPERLLPRTTGTIRVELTGPAGVDVWHLSIADGRVTVDRAARDADTVIRTDREFFARMARGEAKPLTAWLRNDLTVQGRFRLVVLLERLFAAPPGGRHPRAVAAGREGTG
ncbi:SCP2 sterol-binding domain-containing protein [Micromonospora auratinigra]|uniref:SCP-2 sterol transfer family protein n=1 Tax=Micromonospora auratinigra TaxID=261654 RepID=A0A1A8ZDI5_9ACTN|nr:SCP2 sterol-binding domain-containing protein [Micromonospora auratinigra]SBT41952.1 SCP-2 sterol transfer family protein [Micromonospora auratinigra]